MTAMSTTVAAMFSPFIPFFTTLFSPFGASVGLHV
jgi:hypothetical protein